MPSDVTSLELRFDDASPTPDACSGLELPLLLLSWTAPASATYLVDASGGEYSISVGGDCVSGPSCQSIINAEAGVTYPVYVFSGSPELELSFYPLE